MSGGEILTRDKATGAGAKGDTAAASPISCSQIAIVIMLIIIDMHNTIVTSVISYVNWQYQFYADSQFIAHLPIRLSVIMSAQVLAR